MDDEDKALAIAETAEIAPRPVDEMERRFNRIKDKDLRITRGVNRFAEVPMEAEKERRQEMKTLLADGTDDELRARGWSRIELRMAIYGTMSKRDAPVAATAAHERLMAHIRRSKPGRQVNNFNLNQITIPAPRPLGPQDRVVIADKRK